RAKSDLLLNNTCEVFNGKIVRGRDKPIITLLEYIREHCMKRIMNVQGVIDKSCWNMALNDRATAPSETKSTCPTTLLPPKHHVQVGRPRKKRKRSKHKDEPFVKDGKVSRKGRTITCQSCENTGHNKAICKGQGRKAKIGGNNAEASSSLSAAAGEGGEGGAGVASQGLSYNRWTKKIV
ncbi:hypothetical protein Tco_1366676, partial [Tanacetum coccineum]